ncbi:phage tail tip lysozyme [Enterococcus sp. LJL51]|uniref:phage tail tip lysozyme n=1 Tax=Enterococcus sp. LJL51 TaxID=3416656 RepID=UPI003CEBD026
MKKIILLLFLPLTITILFLFMIITMLVDVETGNTEGFSPENEIEKVALDIYNFVLKNGGTKEFACAWIGNIEHESGLIPSRIQSDLSFNELWAHDPSIGGYAFGLPQWDRERRVNMLNKAKEMKKDWKSVEYQMEFAWNHDGSDSTLLKSMSTQQDLNKIAVDILIKWERAGTKNDPIEQSRRKTSANNWYNRLAKGSLGNGSANIGGGKIDILEAKMGQGVYNGECYGLTSYYVDSFDTKIHLGAGSSISMSGNISGADTISAALIGKAFYWEQNGWQVIHNPNYSDVRAGDIINFNQGGYASSVYGHTGIVTSVEGENRYTIYEQNAEQGRICAKYSRTWGKEYTSVASVIRKK